MMRPWFTLVRFPNLLILAVALLFAWFHAGGGAEVAALIPAILAAVAIVAAFYIENDRRDVKVDAVNAANRPLVTGAVSEKAARGAGLVLFAIGWAAAWFAGPLVLGFAAFWTAALALYETALKRTGLPGNILVAVVASSPLILGAWLAGERAAGIVPFAFGFVLHLSREIAKDIADQDGDRTSRRTLVESFGEEGAWNVLTICAAALILWIPFPYLTAGYDLLYLLPALALAFVLMTVLLFARAGETRNPRAVSGTLKWAMLLILLILGAGRGGVV